MVRSRAALKLRQSQFREKYIETSYIKLYAKPKYRNFKVRIEPWMAYRTFYYCIEICGILVNCGSYIQHFCTVSVVEVPETLERLTRLCMC